MVLKLATPPAVEPVTAAEMQTHLNLPAGTDDAYLGTLITAAREYAEMFQRRALITQTWNLYLDDFPSTSAIALPKPPLQSVVSVQYTDENGDPQTLTVSTDYVVDALSEPGWIVLPENVSWPSDVLSTPNAVTIQFKAGYGDAASDVPEATKLALKHIVAGWYNRREEQSLVRGGSIVKVSRAADALLWPNRFYEFA